MASHKKPRALVTGGSSGIGLGIVNMLTADGYDVGVLDVQFDASEVWGRAIDVSNSEQVNAAIAEFGEAVLYRPLSEKKKRGDIKPRYKDGIWLGMTSRSTECFIGTPDGVVRSWAVRRLPSDIRWNRTIIQ